MIPDSPIAPNSSREIIGVRFHQESCIKNLKKKNHNRKKIRFRILRVRFHQESCIQNLKKKIHNRKKSDSAFSGCASTRRAASRIWKKNQIPQIGNKNQIPP